jgi:hypothetical protein
MVQKRGICRVLVEKPEGKGSGIDVRIILRWIVKKWDVGVWTGSRWLWIGTDGRHL